jgi:dienelactone hydrolase
MFGDQRVADVLVALEYARNHKAVNPNLLFITGYSHGGWTVMESLAYNNELPRGLADSPPDPLVGVRGVIAWYPYCGIATRFRNGWQNEIPVLMLLAAEDEVTDPRPCADIAQRQAALGLPVDWHIFKNVGHGFDTGEDWVRLYDAGIHDKARLSQLNFLEQHSG